MPGNVTVTVAEYRALRRREAGLPPTPPPSTRQEADAAAEANTLQALKNLAKQHDWLGQHSWHVEEGLLCWLVREKVLMVQVLRPGRQLTPAQRTWLARVEFTGDVEVYLCAPGSRRLEELKARLAQPQEGA